MAADRVVVVVLDEPDKQLVRRLVAALDQLERDGGEGPLLAHTTRLLLATRCVGVAAALEAIEASISLGADDITDEQAFGIMRQMAMRHVSGVAG
jgi:hypothetical protein